MSINEENDTTEDFSDDELIIRRKKAPEQRTGVTGSGVLRTVADALDALRAKGPLVQCMTNTVSSFLTANALRALGAASAMVEDLGEASQFTAVADSLLVNVGTITKPQSDVMRAAVSHANMGGKPWVLDPVGVGALPLRTFTAKELMRRFPALIRGNAAEIMFLVNNQIVPRGEARAIPGETLAQCASRLAGVTRAAVLVTGAVDYVAAEGTPVVAIENGADVMARVTGVGCAQGAIGAAFLGALGAKARWESALSAALVVALAGEQAKAKGPGSFIPAFLDQLDALRPDDVLKLGKVQILG